MDDAPDTPAPETAPPTRRPEVLLAVGCTLPLVLAHTWPHDFGAEGRLEVWAGWVLSLVSMLQFQLGLALGALCAALLWRRRRVGALAILPALAVCLGPWLWSLRPRAQPEASGPTLTLATVNLLGVNRRAVPQAGILAELAAADPELLVLQEYSPRWHAAFQASPLATRYPHRLLRVRRDSFGLALYSKRPLLAATLELPLGDDLPQLRAELELDGTRIALYGFHLLPPRTFAYTARHRQQLARLLALLEAEQLPAVLAGDFNFSERSPQAARLRGQGWLDALDEVGWGRETTWPTLSALAHLPGLRLDHVYVRGLLPCLARTGVGEGSDHRPVFATVALR